MLVKPNLSYTCYSFCSEQQLLSVYAEVTSVSISSSVMAHEMWLGQIWQSRPVVKNRVIQECKRKPLLMYDVISMCCFLLASLLYGIC